MESKLTKVQVGSVDVGQAVSEYEFCHYLCAELGWSKSHLVCEALVDEGGPRRGREDKSRVSLELSSFWVPIQPGPGAGRVSIELVDAHAPPETELTSCPVCP